MLKKHLKKMLVIFIVIVICLSSLEIGLRFLGKMPSNTAFGENETFEDSFRLKRNFIKVYNWPTSSFTIYTNSFGFRDKKIGERNIYNKPYIIFLGDSMTFANGVDYQDSFVGIFHELASKNKGVEVLNMAVGGHHFHDQEKLFLNFSKKITPKPSYVFVCFNEYFIYRFDSTHKDHFIKDGYLFDKKVWRLAYLKRILSSISSAYFTLRNGFRRLQTKYFNFDDKRPDSYLKMYSKNNEMYNPDTIKRYKTMLNRFEKYCQEINATPVYLYIPTADSFNLNNILWQHGENLENYDSNYYEKLIEDYSKKRKIKFISLKTVLKDQHEIGKILRFKIDGHFNMFANRVIGEFIYSKTFSPDGINLLSK